MSGLKRYTELPYLLHMLMTKQITLLSPSKWVDRNDSYFLRRYAERRKVRSMFVMCLSNSAATYHHWHVFAPNASGVRIEFHETRFRRWAEGIEGARLEPVDYLKLDKRVVAQIAPDRLPFAKRHAFRHEGEVRLLVERQDKNLAVLQVPFEYDLIKQVIVSPWLAASAIPSVIAAIKSAAPDSKFSVRGTTMLESRLFMSAAENEA